jgi:hypothetical protein
MVLWLARLVLTHLHPHQLQHPYLLQQQLLEPRASVLSFQPWCFFFGGLPFALLVLQCGAALSCLSCSKCVMGVALLFGPLTPRLATSAVAHFGGSQTVPWPLILRLLASAELCSPCLIISRTIGYEWTRSRWSPWLAAGCPLSA